MTTIFSKATSALLLFVLIASSAPLVTEAASKPAIKLTAPSAKSSFAKNGSGIIPIAWEAKNVPDKTLVIVELASKKLKKGGTNGGGSWQSVVAAGNSTGSYNWDIEGVGRPDAGTYKVRALLQECVSGDCTKNPFFPGVKKTKTYAKSKWVNISITTSGRNESDEATEVVESRTNGPIMVSLTPVGGIGDSLTLSASQNGTFNYYPSGDVVSCTVTGNYEGGKRKVEHGWKNAIQPGQYGTATFSAVAAHPLKTLQSVEVVCKNAASKATDTVSVTVTGSSAEADYKILTGKTGKTTFKKGEGTKADAEAYCKQAYNDPKIHKNTRVQCYFDGERFEDIKAFKG